MSESETDISPTLRLEGDAARLEAVVAVTELLGRLKIGAAWVGEVALAAWMGEPLGPSGAVDVLAVVPTDRSRQIPMMARHHGFRIDEEEARRTEELDLLPMTRMGEGEGVRVHVLFATNALYGTMVRDGADAVVGETAIRIVAAEDLALLMLVGGMPGVKELIARLRLRAGARFDPEALNRKLSSIGLAGEVIR